MSETTGHETETQDAFEMSDSEFQEHLTAAQEGESVEKTEIEIPGTAGEKIDTGDNSREKPFSLPETQPEGDTQGKNSEKHIEIVHNGRVHRITKEKAVELAQKGFDYDTKVGPHSRLVQLVSSDPGAAQALNNYIQGKINPKPSEFKPKSLDEFNGDETAWFAENMRAYNEANRQNMPQRPIIQRENPIEQIARALMARDPENYHKVAPQLDKFGQQLSVQDYQKVNSDFATLCQFYDHVKEQVIQQQPPIQKSQPSFRTRSGGGEPPRNTAKNKNYAWDLPKKDFQAILSKVKGF